MDQKAYRFSVEPTGDMYDLLVQVLLQYSSVFGLVWRDQFRFAETATRVRADLRSLELKHSRTDRWPGTRLIGHQALVVTFRSDGAAFEVLRRPGSLFGWLRPTYPEDLWFAESSGKLVCGSVSHEEDAWVFGHNVVAALANKIGLEPEEDPPDDQCFGLAV